MSRSIAADRFCSCVASSNSDAMVDQVDAGSVEQRWCAAHWIHAGCPRPWCMRPSSGRQLHLRISSADCRDYLAYVLHFLCIQHL